MHLLNICVCRFVENAQNYEYVGNASTNTGEFRSNDATNTMHIKLGMRESH